MPRGKFHNINIRVNSQMYNDLRALAEQEDEWMSEIVRMAVERYVLKRLKKRRAKPAKVPST